MTIVKRHRSVCRLVRRRDASAVDQLGWSRKGRDIHRVVGVLSAARGLPLDTGARVVSGEMDRWNEET